MGNEYADRLREVEAENERLRSRLAESERREAEAAGKSLVTSRTRRACSLTSPIAPEKTSRPWFKRRWTASWPGIPASSSPIA